MIGLAATSRRLVFGWTACIVALLCVPTSGFPGAEPVQTHPDVGCQAVYVDIDHLGRILEIDYSRGTGHVLGNIDLTSQAPRLLMEGWVFDRGQRAALLLLEPAMTPGWFGRIYLYSGRDGSMLQETSVRIDLTSGDYGILPLNATTMLIEYQDTQRQQRTRLILDIAGNSVIGTFDFPIPSRARYAYSTDGSRLYVAAQMEATIQILDVSSYRRLSAVDVGESMASDPAVKTVVGALTAGDVLANKYWLDQTGMELVLWNMVSGRARAVSQRLPFLPGRYFLTSASENEELEIAGCIERVVSGRYEPTGRFDVFSVKNRRIMANRTIEFNPKTETVLYINGDGYARLPRSEFNYISLLAVRKKVLEQMPGRYTPALVSRARDALAQSIEMLANPETDIVKRRLQIE